MAKDKKGFIEKIKGIFSKKEDKIAASNGLQIEAIIHECESLLSLTRSKLMEYDMYQQAEQVLNEDKWQIAKNSPTPENIENAKHCQRVCHEENMNLLLEIENNYKQFMNNLDGLSSFFSEMSSEQIIEYQERINTLKNVISLGVKESIKRYRTKMNEYDANIEKIISQKESLVMGKSPNETEQEAINQERLQRLEFVVDEFLVSDENNNFLIDGVLSVNGLDEYIQANNSQKIKKINATQSEYNQLRNNPKFNSETFVEESAEEYGELVRQAEDYMACTIRLASTYLEAYKDISSQIDEYIELCDDPVKKKALQSLLRKNAIKYNFLEHFLSENYEKSPEAIDAFVESQIVKFKELVQNYSTLSIETGIPEQD